MPNPFGWSLPPGCSNSDIDRAFGTDGPCALCGLPLDDCQCVECPQCGSVGCIEHESKETLWKRLERWKFLIVATEQELRRRGDPLSYVEPDIAPPPICAHCGHTDEEHDWSDSVCMKCSCAKFRTEGDMHER